MSERVYTYTAYQSPLLSAKTAVLILSMGVFSSAVGLFENNFTISYLLGGLTIGAIIILIFSQIRMSYKLQQSSIHIGVTFRNIVLPTLNREISYNTISDIEFDTTQNRKFGYRPFGSTLHYNLGGNHIRIKRYNKKDITLSGTQPAMELLKQQISGYIR